MAEKILLSLDKKLKKIIPGFLENRQKDLDNLNAAIKEKSFKKIEDIGHQLKGSAGSYGFITLSHLGKDLEDAARHEDLNDANLVVAKISEHLKLLEIDFE